MQSFNRKTLAGTLLVMFLFTSACSLEVSISDLSNSLPVDVSSQRTDVDFTSSEIVTTSSGAVIKGSFGELSEKKILSNGVTFDGVFYE